MTKQTVGKWQTTFLTTRLDGLLDEPRPGAPRTVTDTDVEAVLTRTLESTVRGGGPRTVRAAAAPRRGDRQARSRTGRMR